MGGISKTGLAILSIGLLVIIFSGSSDSSNLQGVLNGVIISAAGAYIAFKNMKKRG